MDLTDPGKSYKEQITERFKEGLKVDVEVEKNDEEAFKIRLPSPEKLIRTSGKFIFGYTKGFFKSKFGDIKV